MGVGRKALGLLLALCPSSFALNPALDINQYAHTAWTVREGFFKATIGSIAQTPDGYLWLGTEFGLLQFDGVRSVPWQPPVGEQLPSNYIRTLLVARDGRLWIGTDKGLASWKDSKLTHYPDLAGRIVQKVLEDREGTIWVGEFAIPTGRLCAIQNGGARCYGEDGSFGNQVLTLYEDSRGNLWAEAATGLWRWRPGPPKLYLGPALDIRALTEGDDGALLILSRDGIRHFVNGKAKAYSLPGVGRQFKQPYCPLPDRNGALWIGTGDRGLFHMHQGRTDLFTQSDGLSADLVKSIFEDREGNIWVGTQNGLDRFRDFAVSTISAKQGLSNEGVLSTMAARDGSVWLGTLDGLNRWKNGQITNYRKRSSGLPDDAVESLYQDHLGQIWVSTAGGIARFENGQFIPVTGVPGRYVHSIAEDRAGDLWFSHDDQGLFRLHEGRVIEQIPWARLGSKDYASAVFFDPVQGGLWVGFSQGGIAYFKDGQVRTSYTVTDGLGEGRVTGLQIERDSTLWAATQGGLSRVKNGHVVTLTSKNGLPCDTVHWAAEGNDHSFWLYTPCGLVRIARTELDAWTADPKRAIQTTVFDSSDGVRTHERPIGYSPLVAKSADGKLWFLPSSGVSVIDPRHLPMNKLPPPVHIEQITADRKVRWQNLWSAAASNLPLPALSHDLQIDYTALSLVAPEKIRFKYKLEGYDADWQEAGNRRQAFYTNLGPRNYRFRVTAANNDGVWNEAGASLGFSIAPAYYQTAWFASLVVAGFLGLLVGLHQLRLVYLTKQFNARLEGRVSERTRVARDLHDTLLQSFQGVLLKFSTVRYVIHRSPDEAVETLDRLVDQARAAVTEGRDAVQGLRSSIAVSNDLARAITTFGEGLTADRAGPNCPEFRVFVEGKSRELPPMIRDEVYKISCECLRNAFRHAQAKRIEVQVRYEPRRFWLQILDNGKGIDPAVLSAGGRAGHHGLPGLHERAELAGGKLSVRSQLNSGTEIELAIPGSIAYLKPTHSGRAMSAAQTTGGKTDGTKETG